MRRAIGPAARIAGLLALTALSGGRAAAQEPTVRVARGDDYEMVETVVGGTIVDLATARVAEGPADVLLLVGERPAPEPAEGEPPRRPVCPDAAAPLRLIAASVRGDDPPRVLRDGLPADATGLLAIDLDGDGVDERLLVRPGRLVLLASRAEEDRLLLADDALGVGTTAWMRSLWSGLDARRWLPVLGPGGLRLYAAGPSPMLVAEVAPERSAFLWNDVLGVRSPPVDSVGETDDALHFVSPSRGGDVQRIGLDHIAVATEPGPDGRAPLTTVECWFRLPEPEDVVERFPLMRDGGPFVLLTTKEAGKVGLSAEKRLRLYAMTSDRTRLGHPPVWAVESRMNLWQAATVRLLDVDGDGRRDLAIGYWKGLTDSRVVVDVYRAADEGEFETKTRTTAFDIDEGDRSFVLFDRDLDGDGLPDLVARTTDGLSLHRGIRSRRGDDLFARRSIVVPFDGNGIPSGMVIAAGWGPMLTGGSGPPIVARLDADRPPSLLAVRRADAEHPGAVAVIRLLAAGDD